jgi:hypothetical protein
MGAIQAADYNLCSNWLYRDNAMAYNGAQLNIKI